MIWSLHLIFIHWKCLYLRACSSPTSLSVDNSGSYSSLPSFPPRPLLLKQDVIFRYLHCLHVNHFSSSALSASEYNTHVLLSFPFFCHKNVNFVASGLRSFYIGTPLRVPEWHDFALNTLVCTLLYALIAEFEELKDPWSEKNLLDTKPCSSTFLIFTLFCPCGLSGHEITWFVSVVNPSGA